MAARRVGSESMSKPRADGGLRADVARHLYGNNHRCLYEPPGEPPLAAPEQQRWAAEEALW